jgi:hypothetical protein
MTTVDSHLLLRFFQTIRLVAEIQRRAYGIKDREYLMLKVITSLIKEPENRSFYVQQTRGPFYRDAEGSRNLRKYPNEYSWSSRSQKKNQDADKDNSHGFICWHGEEIKAPPPRHR